MAAGLAAVCVVAWVVAGCGGSVELSDRQLRATATRACTLASRQADRIPQPSKPSGGAAFVARGIAVLEPEYRRLKALHPPSDLAQVYDISLTAFRGKLAAMKAAVRHLHHGLDPVIAMKTLESQLAPLETSENGAWQALQVPACLNR